MRRQPARPFLPRWSRSLLAAALLACLAGAAGAGDGRLIVEAMEYPWSAIGRVNAGGRGHCTGFLIGPRRVLTAAHCLYDAVQGRWRGAIELHFVAGYQRDRYLIHAKVARYRRAPAFDATNPASTANLVADWAVLTLAEPIGRQAGWLGVLDKASIAGLEARRASLFQAGYRSGRAHVMTANTHCRPLGLFEKARGLAHDCEVFHGDSGAPLLMFAEGRPYAVGIQVARIDNAGRQVGGAVLLTALGAALGGGETAAIPADGVREPGAPPAAGSPASPLPLRTIDLLLRRLGYLGEEAGGEEAGGEEAGGEEAGGEEAAAERETAIRRFQAAGGYPATGAPSLALLGQLLAAE